MKHSNCVKLAADALLASAFAVSMSLSLHASAATSLTLTKGTATLLESSANFAGIVHDGSRIVVSYGKGSELYIRPFDTNFNALAAATRLTSVGNVTDHKHIFFQNFHYLLYSTRGDDDLYLIKVDNNFVQVGTTVTVALNSTTTRTNDMLLTTDGTYIFTGQFRPSDLNGNERQGHLIKRYDANLANVAPDFTANAYPHTNTASIMPLGNGMIIVAPSNPVFSPQVQTQRDLLLLRFDSSFQAVDTSAKKLVDSTTITHRSNGDGIWMSTGLAYDSQSDKLIVGHTFAEAASGSDTGRLHLRVFDGTSFSQTYTEIMVDSILANRAHFLLLDDTLFVVYDLRNFVAPPSSPSVYGLKYALTRTATPTTVSASDCLFNWAERNYPSLFSPAATSQTVSPYYFRYYSTTNSYLGISAGDNHVYYLANGNLSDAGPASTWFSTAGCQ